MARLYLDQNRAPVRLRGAEHHPEGPGTLTDGSDDSGCKNHRIGPVPVVEGLVPCDGHALTSSIGYDLERDNGGQRRQTNKRLSSGSTLFSSS